MSVSCDFVPSICKGEDAKYSGKLVLKPLSYEDRLDLIEAQAQEITEAGEDDGKKAMALLRFAKNFSRNNLADHFVSSTITRIEDGKVFSTLEEIKIDGPVSGIIPEVCSALISGQLSLGK